MMVSIKSRNILGMSLLKQLWLSIFLLMVLAFGGSFLISTISSKNYLETQLQTKNIDNATALALSMSQMEKNPVNMELLVSAQFDSGHYQLIRLSDPNDRVIAERKSDSSKPDVPQWFVNLVSIDVHPGYALVQDGWSQYGRLTLESDSRFAYEELWHGSLNLLFMSLVVGVLSGIIGSLILRFIMRPLKDVVNQAEALGERRFITIKEPKTLEFKVLVKAMNHLSSRIRKMLDDESKRLEQMRREANYDGPSGLMNRSYFFSRVDAYISNEEAFSEGVLVVSRLTGLAEINQALGHAGTDAFLHRLGTALEALCKANPNLLAGRLTGADFVVFSGLATDSYALSSQIKGVMLKAASLPQAMPEPMLPTVASKFGKSDTVEALYQLVANVLTEISMDKVDALHVIGHEDLAKQHDNDEAEWRKLLTSALDARRLKLAYYPVLDTRGLVIHQESPVRLQLNEGEAWLPAGEFISWANRLDLVTRIDELVIEKALEELNKGGDDIGLNISARAICNPEFVQQMVQLIKDNPESATRLWLEVPEQGVFEHLPAFRAFCSALKPLGCKIGIEHVGAQISRLGELHDLGLDYIKIDISVIRDIDKNTGNQAFLRGLCLIAHSIGLMALAEGVQTGSEIATLPDLGIDGMTGPGIKLTD